MYTALRVKGCSCRVFSCSVFLLFVLNTEIYRVNFREFSPNVFSLVLIFSNVVKYGPEKNPYLELLNALSNNAITPNTIALYDDGRQGEYFQ